MYSIFFVFCKVLQEYKVIFRKQEVMKTFLQYDGTKALEAQWGRKGPNMALRKEANWIPFIQVWSESPYPVLSCAVLANL